MFFNFKHKTLKKGRKVISGSGTTKPKSKLSITAKEYVPASRKAKSPSPTAVVEVPVENNVLKKFEKLSISNGVSNTFMSGFTSEFIKMRKRMENAVAIDCEMVGIGLGKESALAHVAIVDFNGNALLDKYVIPKGGIESITNYRTNYSGITPAKLEGLNKEKHSFDKIKREAHKILKDKIIVGHGLINDFKVLDFMPNPDNVWDSTEMDIFKQDHPYRPGIRQARKLKVLAKEFADNNIQGVDKRGHSPLEDARASMNLYRVSLGYPKVVYANMSK
jgi:hypothetical protein